MNWIRQIIVLILHGMVRVMSKFYTQEEVVSIKYDYDLKAIKDHINNYLKDNPLEEEWENQTYSRKVVCDRVSRQQSVRGEYLQLKLSYVDVGYSVEDSYIDEDLPMCDKFESFLNSIDLPVGIHIQSGYYAK